MSVLIFAEKPSQGRDYANAFTIKRRHQSHIELEKCSIFPNGAIITWGIGHLVSLLMPYEYDEKYKRWSLDQLPIVPDRFKYKIKKQTKEHYQKVKKLMKQASEIIIDRKSTRLNSSHVT